MLFHQHCHLRWSFHLVHQDFLDGVFGIQLAIALRRGALPDRLCAQGRKNKGKLGTNNSSDSTAAPIPVPTFAVILLGGNGAIEEKIFSGKSFIISGLFEEVSSHAKTALDKIKEMIASFGGKVNKRFSKNTSEYRFRVMIYCHINEL